MAKCSTSIIFILNHLLFKSILYGSKIKLKNYFKSWQAVKRNLKMAAKNFLYIFNIKYIKF